MLVLLLIACADLPAGGPSLAFGFPLPERERFDEVIGVDHDPASHDGPLGAAQCVDHDGRPFPHCYDGHDGTDYLLDGGFEAMDAGSTPVVAAASGVVVSVADGNYDRCHADVSEPSGVSCDGHEMVGNHVILQHLEGVRSLYWHLKSGSVLVEVGQWVGCGEPLGLVGSSGRSSKPHLHFEVDDDEGFIDPYAGTMSQPETWWAEQEADDGLPGAGCAAW